MMTDTNDIEAGRVIAATRMWLERAVIGLQLCPFAAGVYLDGRVRFRCSEQDTPPGLLEDLRAELLHLQAADPGDCETCLLIHPRVLTDFGAFNDFLSDVDALLVELDLEGELQVASFHPDYQFAGTAAADIENYTNRSPYPVLHVLRESSIELAIADMPDPSVIYRRNIQRLRQLGLDGWRRLWADPVYSGGTRGMNAQDEQQENS
jgi:hypothetical protein